MPETKEEIITHRTELEIKITELLKKSASRFVLADILRAIREEKETGDFHKVIMMFDGDNSADINVAVKLATDAWNYFPHGVLNGLSPAEMLLEHHSN
ncbi:hypothetical protein KGM48_00780 [Patescibacteria group bacterium]|nr:hypothetical protein [Patescibacteria group bacterium]